ncbi:MAG: TnpR protein [Candidatus Carbobacillus altaicus]|uniref:TnpR protein n=1 Tax=Candidatus Carbonibacillus altaicus TaxID=2163959 RepID=A0A2R6XZJ7_9BACL|nr:MAG: TnpR protein [Candidatus Carbobacillus altaicus]
MHDILVEKILHAEDGQRYPICIGGKRNCPPEDVGGPWGYQDFLEAIRDPSHPEHENMLKWIGGSFDPEAFDLAETNEALKEALKTR